MTIFFSFLGGFFFFIITIMVNLLIYNVSEVSLLNM